MDNESKIAACIICTISDALKDCNRCKFNAGLDERTRQRIRIHRVLKLFCEVNLYQRFIIDPFSPHPVVYQKINTKQATRAGGTATFGPGVLVEVSLT